ncbi:MAG: EamA family transporter [Ruminococcaceae bacterium]|nr:EamA family transporter [Oscillospiraceae bacterium]
MKKGLIGSALVFMAGVLWGFMGVFVRGLSVSGFSPLHIIMVRAAVSAVAMAVSALIADRGSFRVKPKDLWCFFGTGIVSLALFGYCYFTAIEKTSMSVAAILLYTAPIMVMVMSALLFREKMTLQKVLCLCAAFIGCVFVTGILSGSEVKIAPDALGFGLMSGFAYALYSIFGRFAINRGYSSMTITLYTFAFAFAGLFIITDLRPVVSVISEQPSLILSCIAMGICTGFLPYLLYTAGLERLESGKASIVASVEPAVATVCGMIFFDEFPDLFGWLGIALVLGAIVFLNIDFKKK